jgi:RimJ/RimL family protein N-acetyltransferase
MLTRNKRAWHLCCAAAAPVRGGIEPGIRPSAVGRGRNKRAWHLCCVEVPTLRDAELILRAPAPGDAEAVTAACQDPEIQRWTFVPSPYRREHAEAWIAAAPQRARDGVAVTLLAFGGEGRLAGSFSLMELDLERGYGEIGYWVAPWARGRGVATRSVRLVHEWAVGTLGLRRLEILPHAENAPSRRVAERCGYADTGEVRKAPRGGKSEPVYVVYAWEA